MNKPLPDAKAIFFAAIEKDSPEKLASFLDDACQGDADLRARVEELLRAHAQVGRFLGGADSIEATTDQAMERPGTQIGPYKLLEQIGEGGFGVVYMAEQHEPVRRKVALKVLKPGMDTRQIVARFEAERQALALMDHPNIARVFDGGTSPSGRPYFVMELVKGAPITDYCDQHRLTPRQRLELFMAVCHAVQHAHQKGVIHRDLKPTNVLVALHDTQAVVKVIDFGVAKALGQELTDKTLFTGFAQMVGTPLYMSPEQAGHSGLDIDTRTDIYALGVLLYELLTGTTPFDKQRFQRAAFDEIRRIICEEEPQKPSTRLSSVGSALGATGGQTSAAVASLASIAAVRGTEPAKLARLVRGELDWIVMKALDKDRSRRYETASGFAADIGRYLDDEPVVACPPSAAYRFRKFARRNKAALGVAGVVLFFLVLLGSGAGWAVRDRVAREEQVARIQAQREAEIAREREERLARLATQLEFILDEVQRLESDEKWDDALAAARRAESVLAAGESDEATQQRVRQALHELEMVRRLEQIRLERFALVEGTFNDPGAVGAYARAFREFGVDVESLPAAEAIARLAAHRAIVVPLVAALDDWVEARRMVRVDGWRALVDVARGLDTDPLRGRLRAGWGTERTPQRQEELHSLAESPEALRQPPGTLTLLAKSLGIYRLHDLEERVLRQAQQQHPGDFWVNVRLGRLLHERQNYHEAVRFYSVAAGIQPRSPIAYQNLARAFEDLNRLEEAAASLDSAIDRYRKIVELDPSNPFPHFQLGVALYSMQKREEAVACFRQAAALDPENPSFQFRLGRALTDQGQLDEAVACFRKAIELAPSPPFHLELGQALAKQGKLDEAIACYRTAMEMYPTFLPTHRALGNALKEQGKLDEAIACYRTAIEADPKYSAAHTSLADALTQQGKLDEAVACCRVAIELNPLDATAHRFLGNALRRQRKLEEAIASNRRAVELAPQSAHAHNDLGITLNAHGEVDEAIACYRRAIELDVKGYAFPHNNLGLALMRQRKVDEAIACYRAAIEVSPSFVNAHMQLGSALREQGKLDEALECYRTAAEVAPHHPGAQLNLGLACYEGMKLEAAVAAFEKAVQLTPRSPFAWRWLGWAQYRSGAWEASIESLTKSCELHPGGADDSGQWIVLALAHGKLARQTDLPVEQRAGHQTAAQHWYDRAVTQIDGGPGMRDPAIHAFRAEAAALFDQSDD